MAKKGFNLIEWFNNKIAEEKSNFDLLTGKLSKLSNEIKSQMMELKDDSHHLVPILNGIHGDSMDENGHPALIRMSFRYNSRDISVEKIAELIDFAKSNGQLIIMAHGLMNDESIWQSNPEDIVQRMGSFIENQKKANILYIRYNTGRHISQNGKDLSRLIQRLIDHYRNEIKELILIGHSMGGLVLRSACNYCRSLEHQWVLLLKKVFLIGVPNEGSYLARVAYMTQYFLRKVDPSENSSYAKFFDIRSNGIKDLSFGFLIDEDWQNPDYEYAKEMKASKVYPVQNVEYYLIAGTVADENKKYKIFTFFGDGLVEKESALSNLFKTNAIDSGLIHFKLFSEQNHLSLLEDKNVQSYMVECLGW